MPSERPAYNCTIQLTASVLMAIIRAQLQRGFEFPTISPRSAVQPADLIHVENIKIVQISSCCCLNCMDMLSVFLA